MSDNNDFLTCPVCGLIYHVNIPECPRCKNKQNKNIRVVKASTVTQREPQALMVKEQTHQEETNNYAQPIETPARANNVYVETNASYVNTDTYQNNNRFQYSQGKRCENCGSYNVTMSLVSDKKSCCSSCLGSILFVIIGIPIEGYIVSAVLDFFMSKELAVKITAIIIIIEIIGAIYDFVKDESREKVICVCQNCGHKKEINNGNKKGILDSLKEFVNDLSK